MFPSSSQERFGSVFRDPPLTETELEEVRKGEREKTEKERGKRRWKTVDERAVEREAERAVAANAANVANAGAGDAMDMDEVDGEPMLDEDEDIDGEPMDDDDEDVDGEPMADSDDEASTLTSEVEKRNAEPPSRREALAASIAAKLGKGPAVQAMEKGATVAVAGGKRERPKAADMFADSDGE